MNKKIGLMVAGAAVVASVKNAAASAYFELPAADVTQITTDFKTAGAVVLGIVILFFGYKMVRQLASGRSPR